MALVYRSHFQIITDILDITRDYNNGGNSVNITLLIQKANISYGRITKILKTLVHAGLIKELQEDKNYRYRISEKCVEFLHEYIKFHDFIESFGLKV